MLEAILICCSDPPLPLLQLIGLRSFRTAAVLLFGLLAYGEFRSVPITCSSSLANSLAA